jgi:hypothetical protein
MRVQVDLLGQTVDGRATTAADWRRRRSVTLVKLLALAKRHRLHREQIMETLWPDLPPDAAAANLRKAIHFTRRALGAHEIIVLDGEIVALAPSVELVVDAELFEAEAAVALRSHDAPACACAAQRYAGELLPEDRYADWTEEPRERLREQGAWRSRRSSSGLAVHGRYTLPPGLCSPRQRRKWFRLGTISGISETSPLYPDRDTFSSTKRCVEKSPFVVRTCSPWTLHALAQRRVCHRSPSTRPRSDPGRCRRFWPAGRESRPCRGP